MTNSVCGKTMENLRNRDGVRLVNNKKDHLKWTTKPSFVTQKIFGKDLVGIHKIKTTSRLNKYAHCGMCILELSKVPTVSITL